VDLLISHVIYVSSVRQVALSRSGLCIKEGVSKAFRISKQTKMKSMISDSKLRIWSQRLEFESS
jgi:hypothetical protein